MSGAIFLLSCVFVVVTFCREWAEMKKKSSAVEWEQHLCGAENLTSRNTSICICLSFFWLKNETISGVCSLGEARSAGEKAVRVQAVKARPPAPHLQGVPHDTRGQ